MLKDHKSSTNNTPCEPPWVDTEYDDYKDNSAKNETEPPEHLENKFEKIHNDPKHDDNKTSLPDAGSAGYTLTKADHWSKYAQVKIVDCWWDLLTCPFRSI